MGAELFRTDRRTDMTKLVVAFCNIAIAPEKRGEGDININIDINIQLNLQSALEVSCYRRFTRPHQADLTLR